MIEIELAHTYGWEDAIRGMRNPLDSWDRADSFWTWDEYGAPVFRVGPNDLALAQKLVRAGTDHSKFMRQIVVSMDIKAPLYWWKEYDTYKIGTVANSCSTMHKIHAKELTLDSFSHEHLNDAYKRVLEDYIYYINIAREAYLENKDKLWWWQIIQTLPASYNQLRTVTLNYEVLRRIYRARKNHKLDEWRELCRHIETLPYAKELICDA